MKHLIAAALGLWLAASPALSQDFPNRPLRMLIGFAAGGSGDIVGRIVAQPLGDALRQPLVIENRAGASGAIATEAVARAVPDGYTLLLGTVTTHSLAPTLNRKLPYDVARDFAPVILLGSIPFRITRSR